MAGARGYIPLSLNLNFKYVKSHWDTVQAAADGAGRTASRRDWRLTREIIVADTDAEAERIAVDGMYGRFFTSYTLGVVKAFKMLEYYKHSPDVADSDVTPAYMAKHNWLVGSPDTVRRKLAEVCDLVGGFGHLLLLGVDYSENPDAWHRSMKLLAEEVMPAYANH
jgi:alkanesulfonate monooxygenase SsuD/methylene tetrahydromethanopterin reductase-like flavin-dependent oxidoreductase (luciferase family)